MNSMVFCHLGPDLKVTLSWLARRATWEIEKVSQHSSTIESTKTPLNVFYYSLFIALCLRSLTCKRSHNMKPIIEEFIVPSTIQPGETAIFKVIALDPDGDQLTYIWIINGET